MKDSASISNTCGYRTTSKCNSMPIRFSQTSVYTCIVVCIHSEKGGHESKVIPFNGLLLPVKCKSHNYKQYFMMFLWATPVIQCYYFYVFYRIKNIPATAFQDLHSLEWIKLFNNLLTTLHYELMEPVLDTLQHIDIHSEYKIWIRKLHFERWTWMNCSI